MHNQNENTKPIEGSAEFINLGLQYGIPGILNPKKNSVLYKPFNRLIDDGAPIGYIRPLILNTSDLRFIDGDKGKYATSLEYLVQVPHGNFKILGCLCYTEGKKLLFYPSFNSTDLIQYTGNRDQIIRHHSQINIDHFSLEDNLKKWHITHEDGHIQNLKTKKINNNLILWFGLNIQNNIDLEQAYRINKFEYLCPRYDVERRRSILMETLENLEETVITPQTIESVEKNNYFWHFDFYYKKSSNSIQTNLETFNDFNPLFFDELPKEKEISWVSYELTIPNHNGTVIIVAYKMTGKLKDPVLVSIYNGNR